MLAPLLIGIDKVLFCPLTLSPVCIVFLSLVYHLLGLLADVVTPCLIDALMCLVHCGATLYMFACLLLSRCLLIVFVVVGLGLLCYVAVLQGLRIIDRPFGFAAPAGLGLV